MKKEFKQTQLDKLSKKYIGQKTPIFQNECWFVDTDHGVEYGDMMYVFSEFTKSGLIYHYRTSTGIDHEHSFEGVMHGLFEDVEEFSIDGYEDEYSNQEKQYLNTIKERLIELSSIEN